MEKFIIRPKKIEIGREIEIHREIEIDEREGEREQHTLSI